MIKYDWYDPNTKVIAAQIGKPGTGLTAGDIKYSTIGLGFTRQLTENVKMVLFYEIVKNETTALAGYTNDVKDNLFTCRLQFRF